MAFNLTAAIGLDGSRFALGMAKVKNQVRGLKGELASAASNQLTGQLGALFSVGAITAATAKTIEYAGKINDLSEQTDVSREGLQKWDYALTQNGSSIETGVKFFEKLGTARQKALEGNEDAIANFAELGVSIDDLKKKRLEDIGLQIGNAVKDGDIQKLGTALREVGGKAAGELVPAFKAGLQQAFDQAPIINDETIQGLDDVGDAVDRLAGQFRSVLAPAILFVVDKLSMMIDFAKIIGGVLPAMAGALAGGASLKEALAAGQKVSNDVIDERMARENEKNNPKPKGKKVDLEEISKKDKKLKELKAPKEVKDLAGSGQVEVGSLAKSGGFLANEFGARNNDVPKQQLDELKAIKRNTDPDLKPKPLAFD